MVDNKNRNSHKHTKHAKKLYLSSLPSNVTKTQLGSIFGKYGVIESIKLSKDSKNGFCRGFGHISYKSQVDLGMAISAEHRIHGRSIICEPFIEKQEDLEIAKTLNSKRRIFVSNIPSWMTNVQIKNFFSEYGQVVSAYRIEKHGSHKKMPFGYVYFESISSAEKCLQEGFKFMGIRYGFMLFDKYTKNKKERDSIKLRREARIREFKRSIKDVDFRKLGNISLGNSNSVNDRNYANESYEKHSQKHHQRHFFDGKFVKKNSEQIISNSQNTNQLRKHKKHLTANGARFCSKNYHCKTMKKRTMAQKKKDSERIARQLEFSTLKPSSKSYWNYSVKRLRYFEAKGQGNLRFNRPTKLYR